MAWIMSSSESLRRSASRLSNCVTLTIGVGLVTALSSSPLRAQETLQSCYEATLIVSGDKAIDVCGKLLVSNMPPGHDLAVVLNNRGLGYLKNSEIDSDPDKVDEDLDNAIDYFERSIAMEPNYVFAYDNRGDAYRRKQNNTQALADYTKAIELDPTFASAYLGRGKVYEAMNDRARARAEYKAVLAQTGDRPIDKWARGEAQQRLDRIDAPQ
jgi:tetratricopeptide (TPR) repeat protein